MFWWCLSYFLLYFGFSLPFICPDWLRKGLRYITSTCNMLGFLIATILTYFLDRSMLFISGGLFLAYFILFIWVLATIRTKTLSVYHVPAGSYDVVTVDPNTTTNIQLNFFLRYQNQVFGLSTPVPDGKPALTLYAYPPTNPNWIPASASVDTHHTPKSFSYYLQKCYWVIVYLMGLSIPVLYFLYHDGYLLEDYAGWAIVIFLFSFVSYVTKDAKDFFYRFFHFVFNVFLIVCWIIFLFNLLIC
jgi:hypothetical protein